VQATVNHMTLSSAGVSSKRNASTQAFLIKHILFADIIKTENPWEVKNSGCHSTYCINRLRESWARERA
jgi:hypothetical protein